MLDALHIIYHYIIGMYLRNYFIISLAIFDKSKFIKKT